MPSLGLIVVKGKFPTLAVDPSVAALKKVDLPGDARRVEAKAERGEGQASTPDVQGEVYVDVSEQSKKTYPLKAFRRSR